MVVQLPSKSQVIDQLMTSWQWATDQSMASWQWALRTQTNTKTYPWRRDNKPSEHKQTHRPTHGVVTMGHQNTSKHTDQPMALRQWAIRTQTNTHTDPWRRENGPSEHKQTHKPTHGVKTMSHQNTNKHTNQPMASWQWTIRTQTNTNQPMASWQWTIRTQVNTQTNPWR